MPRGDGTGPDGRGGWCTPLWMSGRMQRPMIARPAEGRGFFGRGRGFRNMPYATGQPGWARFEGSEAPEMQISKEQELEYLSAQKDYLNQQIDDLKKRIDELKK